MLAADRTDDIHIGGVRGALGAKHKGVGFRLP